MAGSTASSKLQAKAVASSLKEHAQGKLHALRCMWPAGPCGVLVQQPGVPPPLNAHRAAPVAGAAHGAAMLEGKAREQAGAEEAAAAAAGDESQQRLLSEGLLECLDALPDAMLEANVPGEHRGMVPFILA